MKLFNQQTWKSISKIKFCSIFTRRNHSNFVVQTSDSQSILKFRPAETETSKENPLDKFLIAYALKNQASTSFTTLLEQLNTHANSRLPFILPYEKLNQNSISEKSDLARGIVTVAHVIPSRNKVIIASGFEILDGRLIVTCAHTFYQAALHISSSELDPKSQSIAITHDGELIRIATVESHLPLADLVLLRLSEGRKITSLAVDPYPAPVSTPLLSYDFGTVSLSASSLPTVSYSWQSAEVLFYKSRCGKEAETGTYDELNFMMYSHIPSNGSSGAPIVSKETRGVVGVVRGSEVSYANRKVTGFATPSECLFEAFRLPGIPDGLE